MKRTLWKVEKIHLILLWGVSKEIKEGVKKTLIIVRKIIAVMILTII